MASACMTGRAPGGASPSATAGSRAGQGAGLARLLWHQEVEGDAHRFGLAFADGSASEITAWGAEGGLSVLFPTQVGCAVGCVYCAVGQGRPRRSLEAREMLAAVEAVERALGRPALRADAAGHGEPLLNQAETLRCLQGFLAARPGASAGLHTCGIPDAIRALGQQRAPVELSVTLHSAVQATRDRLMPGAARWPLEELAGVLAAYPAVAPRPALVVALADGVNDSEDELEALAGFAQRSGCGVALSLMGKAWGRSPVRPSARERLERFRESLAARGALVSCDPRERRRTVALERYA